MQSSYIWRTLMPVLHRGVSFTRICSQMQSMPIVSKIANSSPSTTRAFTQSCKAVCQCDGNGAKAMGSSLRQSFSSSRRMFCDQAAKDVTPTGRQAGAAASREPITRVASSEHHQHFSARSPSDFDKKLLVYFGKYKAADDVPELVSVHLINATRNKFRVYANMFIGFLTMSACGIMIYRGRKRAGKGENLADVNMQRHPEHYKKYQKA